MQGGGFDFGVGYNNTNNYAGTGSNSLLSGLNSSLSGIGDMFSKGFNNISNSIGNGLNFGSSNIPGASNINGLTQNLPSFGTPSFSDKYLNRDFLLGSKNNIGLLPGVGGAIKDLGSLAIANQQLQLGKSQYQDQKNIYNNQQAQMQRDSVRTATDLLNNSTWAANWSDEKKAEYIKNHTVNAQNI